MCVKKTFEQMKWILDDLYLILTIDSLKAWFDITLLLAAFDESEMILICLMLFPCLMVS